VVTTGPVRAVFLPRRFVYEMIRRKPLQRKNAGGRRTRSLTQFSPDSNISATCTFFMAARSIAICQIARVWRAN
jgi:hypothetical protein